MHIIDTTWDLRQKISQRVAHPWKFIIKITFSREISNTYMHTYTVHTYILYKWNYWQGHLLKTHYWNNFKLLPDLRKVTFHAHNSKTHFSLSNDSCTHQLTIQPGIDGEVVQPPFAVACF